MKSLFTRFSKDESGATAIEYGLVAALMAVVIVTFFAVSGTNSIGGVLTTIFGKITTAVGS